MIRALNQKGEVLDTIEHPHFATPAQVRRRAAELARGTKGAVLLVENDVYLVRVYADGDSRVLATESPLAQAIESASARNFFESVVDATTVTTEIDPLKGK